MRWHEEGEQNTKYFYRLKKMRYNQKTMKCVINDDGTISRNQSEILQKQAEFYQTCTKAIFLSTLFFNIKMSPN